VACHFRTREALIICYRVGLLVQEGAVTVIRGIGVTGLEDFELAEAFFRERPSLSRASVVCVAGAQASGLLVFLDGSRAVTGEIRDLPELDMGAAVNPRTRGNEERRFELVACALVVLEGDE
jgi:hypothetical protein